MCGIAGRYNFRSRRPVDRDVVRAMTGLLSHRGPDGSGIHVEGDVGLGHRRLAIIDLTAHGAQPMTDGRYWITYNGEIYNFPERRRELEAVGYSFRSTSDTEVILALYARHGADCVRHLRGMFAFAVWDSRERTLFLARDRLGKKPMYYRFDEDGIAFASEPKAFLAEPSFQARPAPTAIAKYLAYQYVPSPLSAFEGVCRLAPAHDLLIGPDHAGEPRRYWMLRYGDKLEISEREAAVELRERLTEAVRIRLISDVPIGAFLSGGVDSSAVVALMAGLVNGPVRTFSIGFEESDHDERAYARLVAQRYGTEHREFVVRPDALAILPRLVWHYGEPYADSSALPTYYLAELTRRHVTVALNGDGGDETFAGYDRYRAQLLAGRFDRLPRPALAALGALAASARLFRGRQADRIARFLDAAVEPAPQRYSRWICHFHPDLLEQICTPEFLPIATASPFEEIVTAFAHTDAPDLLDATLDVDVRTYLPDDLLVKVDIATMAHGLEARSPLLDHEVMEFVARLPSHMKLRNGSAKWILKDALRDLLPPEVVERRKMGFGVPIEAWLRGELAGFTADILLSERAIGRGYFRRRSVERLLAEHRDGVRSWHYQLWNLLMLELWHRMFIDRIDAPLDHPPDLEPLTVVRV